MTILTDKIFTVSELTVSIKNDLERKYYSIQVKGEITNFKSQSSGHYYFNLTDKNAQISAVLFKGYAQNLSRLPKAGDQIVIHGDLSVYPPRGGYQIIVKKIEYSGVGDLLLKLHALKEKLKQLGWFEAARKKTLPKYPKIIGVVTSPTGSVIQDIIHVLSRRLGGFHLILYPVAVQGVGAEDEIAKAIDDFNQFQLADVLIVGRGGGSLEDLWAFNQECVAKAIYESKIPIISAVGHETDYSIADFVADVRAPTPSAASEIVMKEKKAQLENLENASQRISYAIKQKVQKGKIQLHSIHKNPLMHNPYSLISLLIQSLDEKKSLFETQLNAFFRHHRLRHDTLKKRVYEQNPKTKLESHQSTLKNFCQSIDLSIYKQVEIFSSRLKAIDSLITIRVKSLAEYKKRLFLQKNIEKAILHSLHAQWEKKEEKMKKLIVQLYALNPKNVLKRGYCIPFAENNHSVIISSLSLSVGEKVRLLFHDGLAKTTINQIEIGDIYEQK